MTAVEAAGAVDAVETPEPASPTRRPRRRPKRWLIGLIGIVVVAVLIVLAVGLLSSAASNRRADDPRSTLPAGTAALAQLLTDEGVRVVPVDSTDRAAELAGPGTTLVVANAGRLSGEQARRLLAGRPGRVILLRPSTAGLEAFGIAGDTTAAAGNTIAAPDCAQPVATKAGTILLQTGTGFRTEATPALACYRVGLGSAWVRPAGTQIDLVAGGVSNGELGEQGNAAFGMTLFGSQPTLVWLMAERADTPDQPRQTLLPPWWAIGVVQAVVALIVIGIWRGRRLGPIMVEPLPVRVRSSETVIGHGRLYFRIGARDRAAEALRAGARERLGRRFGRGGAARAVAGVGGAGDPDALTAALADRTGRPAAEIWQLLYGPAPGTDDELTALARALDDLDQKART